MKYLQVTFSDGASYAIPADVIAKSRAEYYAKLDADRGDGTYPDNYIREYDYSMKDDYELKDWAWQNMDWKDLKPYARKLKTSSNANYHKEWSSAVFEFKNFEETDFEWVSY